MRVFIVLLILLPSVTIHAMQAELQVHNDILYFISSANSYQYNQGLFSVSSKVFTIDTSYEKPLLGGLFKKSTSIVELPSTVVRKNCQWLIGRSYQSYASGILSCSFFAQTQSINIEIHNTLLGKYNRPYISYNNFSRQIAGDLFYYIGLNVGDEMDSKSIAYIVFNKKTKPELYLTGLNCDNGFSSTIYRRGQQSLCYSIFSWTWRAYNNKRLITLAPPCSMPKQLLIYQQTLWGMQQDEYQQYYLCQYSSSLLMAKQHFFYQIDIKKTLTAAGLPMLAIKQVQPIHQEIDNGALIAYQLIFKHALQVGYETDELLSLVGQVPLEKSKVHRWDTESITTLQGQKQTVLRSIELLPINVVFSLKKSSL